jgi:hypothetical protein
MTLDAYLVQSETAQGSPTGLQTSLCPDPGQTPPFRINSSIRPLLTNLGSLEPAPAGTAFERNWNKGLGCNTVTHNHADATRSKSKEKRRIRGPTAGDKEALVRFANNPYSTPLTAIIERTSPHTSCRSRHTGSIGAKRRCSVTCINLEGLDAHAHNTDGSATQEFHEICHEPPLPDNVYRHLVHSLPSTMIFEGESQKAPHCESSTSWDNGRRLKGLDPAPCASSSGGPRMTLTNPPKTANQNPTWRTPLRLFTSSLSASRQFGRFHPPQHRPSNHDALAGSGRPWTALQSHNLKAPRTSHQQSQSQLINSNVNLNYCSGESGIQPATDQMFDCYPPSSQPVALTVSAEPHLLDRPKRPVISIISNQNSPQAAQLPRRTERSEHVVPRIKGIGAARSSHDQLTSRYTEDDVPIYDPIESSLRNCGTLSSSHYDIYNELYSEPPKYRDPTSSPRFHCHGCQELEVPQVSPPKSYSSLPPASTKLSVTRDANQTSMKTITSAALPILLQIAAAEGIATTFTLTSRHTNANFDGAGSSPAKTYKEQQQKQPTPNNKRCRASGKSWKCMVGNATNRIADDVVLHCFCQRGCGI